eukprot:7387678-Prymnesium_polylepis.2
MPRSSARATASGARASSPSLNSGAVELLQPFGGAWTFRSFTPSRPVLRCRSGSLWTFVSDLN